MRFPFRQFPALALALLSLPAAGQESQANPLLAAISSLRMLSQNSGYIFDGTVLSCKLHRPMPMRLPRCRLPFGLNRPCAELVPGRY